MLAEVHTKGVVQRGRLDAGVVIVQPQEAVRDKGPTEVVDVKGSDPGTPEAKTFGWERSKLRVRLRN